MSNISRRFYLLTILLLAVCFCCFGQEKGAEKIYQTSTLVVVKLSEHIFIHTSYFEIPNYGPFPCNGMIFKEEEEVLIFDTPTDDVVSAELINWVETELGSSVKGIVATHFHEDCLGGLKAFHNLQIPSYAHSKTIDLAKKDQAEIPKNSFEGEMEIRLGNKQVVSLFLGEGHTADNIVCYVPSEETLFGGCLIKEVGAGKGNLNDANVRAWSKTVQKIKKAFPNLKTVIPGHGQAGGVELLDYTIKKFKKRMFGTRGK